MIVPWRMVVASLAIGAIGCSTDAPTEVGDTTPPTVVPTVVATSPVNASAGNARLSIIRATFSRALAPASVTTATFSVTHNTAIAGTVRVTLEDATSSSNVVTGNTYTLGLPGDGGIGGGDRASLSGARGMRAGYLKVP